MSDEKKPIPFVERVREDAQRYLSELLSENEKLRSSVTSLEAEVRRHHEEHDAVKRAFEFERKERERAKEHLDEVTTENSSYLQQFVTVQEQISDLANLYVAAYRLSGTLKRKQILSTIAEIIINLVGSDELAIFELAPGDRELRLISSNGIEAQEFSRIPLGIGVIGATAERGELYLAPQAKPEQFAGLPVTACVPLKADNDVRGVIAIFRLLPQKSALTDADRELLQLLETHAAVALARSVP